MSIYGKYGIKSASHLSEASLETEILRFRRCGWGGRVRSGRIRPRTGNCNVLCSAVFTLFDLCVCVGSVGDIYI